MSGEKQSFMRWWGRRMLIVLPPWVPAFILMAMGAGVWAYVVGIGGTLLLGGIEIGIDYTRRRREMQADRERFQDQLREYEALREKDRAALRLLAERRRGKEQR